MAVRLSVIGSSPAWPNPGGACSGYLVDGKLLLDCGPGVLAKLRQREPWPTVEAIAITHLHLDHWGDAAHLRSGGLLPARQLVVQRDHRQLQDVGGRALDRRVDAIALGRGADWPLRLVISGTSRRRPNSVFTTPVARASSSVRSMNSRTRGKPAK